MARDKRNFLNFEPDKKYSSMKHVRLKYKLKSKTRTQKCSIIGKPVFSHSETTAFLKTSDLPPKNFLSKIDGTKILV
jgi:hypothetical protein